MKYDGVTFVEPECAKMTEKEFIDRHVDAFWLDRDRKTRRRMLADVHRRIAIAERDESAK